MDALESVSTVPVGLPDMWLMHVDSTHFDLIVKKDSTLAKEGSIGERMNEREIDDTAKDVDDSEKYRGPGYMGWQTSEETEAEQTSEETEAEQQSQVKMYMDLKKAYNVLQSDHVQLKEEVTKLKKASMLERISKLSENYKKK